MPPIRHRGAGLERRAVWGTARIRRGGFVRWAGSGPVGAIDPDGEASLITLPKPKTNSPTVGHVPGLAGADPVADFLEDDNDDDSGRRSWSTPTAAGGRLQDRAGPHPHPAVFVDDSADVLDLRWTANRAPRCPAGDLAGPERLDRGQAGRTGRRLVMDALLHFLGFCPDHPATRRSGPSWPPAPAASSPSCGGCAGGR